MSIERVLLLSFALFAIGVFGLLSRRNLIFMLISIEIMLNAIALLFIGAAGYHGNNDGQILYLLVLTLASAEVTLGLALVVRMHRQQVHGRLGLSSLDVDALNELTDAAAQDSGGVSDMPGPALPQTAMPAGRLSKADAIAAGPKVAPDIMRPRATAPDPDPDPQKMSQTRN
ncbi:NADH-quinone oxidoreductase subunit NuoK [Shewanella salipaludis]|uniref:NADH-quinone oxidoreductase subunit K n=1 Tax=Shewanella salipaludis TaxID=2723052 RepID=A0A972JHC3_9GAMM|nr:NADH-quinone oxidoreductase subunit NuoK [Shewanella salipaludis]NMH63848.1 NADH-quinone oxidoreductase subunit NuoK [Shewanella salipaludis]